MLTTLLSVGWNDLQEVFHVNLTVDFIIYPWKLTLADISLYYSFKEEPAILSKGTEKIWE